MNQLEKTLLSKFKYFLADTRWDFQPVMQRVLLKGYRIPDKDNSICLCLSHLTICFRPEQITTGTFGQYVIHCGLTKYQALDCAEGIPWEEETHVPACDRLEMYAFQSLNYLPVTVKNAYPEAIKLVNQIHAHFDTMTTELVTIKSKV